jgi:prevent-host-death family protein
MLRKGGKDMTVMVIGSKEARSKWHDLLDDATAGRGAIIERSGRPVAVLIPYEDYEAILEELEDMRADRRAVAAYEEWERDPSTAIPYEEFRAQLVSVQSGAWAPRSSVRRPADLHAEAG